MSPKEKVKLTEIPRLDGEDGEQRDEMVNTSIAKGKELGASPEVALVSIMNLLYVMSEVAQVDTVEFSVKSKTITVTIVNEVTTFEA